MDGSGGQWAGSEGDGDGGAFSAGGLATTICSLSWDCDTALRVAWCESEWREDAVSAYGHRGIYQIAPVHIPRIEAMGYTWDDMLLAGPNVAVAYALWLEQGWSPWICR